MSDDVQALAEVLVPHHWVTVASAGYNGCRCGWMRSVDAGRPFAFHLATLAAAHVAAARAEERERWAGEVRALAEALQREEPLMSGLGYAGDSLRALLPENRETTPATMSPEQARRILARSKPTEIRTPDGPSISPEATP